jgi:hypothetical protein
MTSNFNTLGLGFPSPKSKTQKIQRLGIPIWKQTPFHLDSLDPYSFLFQRSNFRNHLKDSLSPIGEEFSPTVDHLFESSREERPENRLAN